MERETIQRNLLVTKGTRIMFVIFSFFRINKVSRGHDELDSLIAGRVRDGQLEVVQSIM